MYIKSLNMTVTCCLRPCFTKWPFQFSGLFVCDYTYSWYMLLGSSHWCQLEINKLANRPICWSLCKRADLLGGITWFPVIYVIQHVTLQRLNVCYAIFFFSSVLNLYIRICWGGGRVGVQPLASKLSCGIFKPTSWWCESERKFSWSGYLLYYNVVQLLLAGVLFLCWCWCFCVWL